jgi:hypothetical protein
MTLREFIDIMSHIRQDTYVEYIMGMEDDEREKYINHIAEYFPLPKSPDPGAVSRLSKRFNLYTNILSMKLGQFILLENELKKENSELYVASLIIRPIEEPSFDNEDYEREETIKEALLEELFTDVYSVLQTMLLNREFILFNKFSGVIYNRVDIKEQEEEEEDDYEEDDETTHNSQWFWYKVVRSLANEDITMYPKIYELRMSEVMVELSYRSQVSIIENARARAEDSRQRAMYRR